MIRSPDAHQLALELQKLFEGSFAAQYRSGDRSPIGPPDGFDRNRWLLLYDHLERMGLVEGSPSASSLSEHGQRLAFHPAAAGAFFGTGADETPTSTREEEFEASAIWSRARALFLDYFADGNRDVHLIPRGSLDTAALEALARKGLAYKIEDCGPFTIGDRGVEVCLGEASLDELLG
jgi:hypothetical protein